MQKQSELRSSKTINLEVRADNVNIQGVSTTPTATFPGGTPGARAPVIGSNHIQIPKFLPLIFFPIMDLAAKETAPTSTRQLRAEQDASVIENTNQNNADDSNYRALAKEASSDASERTRPEEIPVEGMSLLEVIKTKLERGRAAFQALFCRLRMHSAVFEV